MQHHVSVSRRGGGALTLLLLSAVVLSTVTLSTAPLGAQGGPPPPPGGPLPPVPVPAQNPQTPEKIVLGKILFWEEQLSSDDTVAWATCHLPEFGGSDPRSFTSAHPGPDAVFGNPNDVFGSPGVAKQECDGTMLDDTIFSFERQVTGRKAPTMINAAYSPTLFWDGRATGTFVDPETGVVLIPNGGALESQAVGPILNSVEMACETRTWDDVRAKLESVTPLFFASNLTPDIVAALSTSPTYPDLFQAAFGTPDITAARIGFALASYQRTLISDQSPFDQFLAGVPGALTPQEANGRNAMQGQCGPCHTGPLLTNHSFQNIGVRPPFEDLGRGDVTGVPPDNGRFRTPNLRNVALRAPYFHNGSEMTLAGVIDFYDAGGNFPSPDLPPINLPPMIENAIEAFLTNALTDPRVAASLPPFDHPTLRTHFRRGDTNRDDVVDISDPIAVLATLFSGGAPFSCPDAADANDDGMIDISDVVATLDRLFAGGAPLPLPSDRSTGPDPTLDALSCN